MFAQALDGIRVLDVGHHIAGPYCTKLLADFGAQVIKVEKPIEGDASRRAGYLPNDRPDSEVNPLFFYLNNNKLGITLNLKTNTGVKIFLELVKKVDILVENFDPGVMPSLGLSYDNLKSTNPGLVMVSISNFGQSGPYSTYKASDLVIQSLGGWVWSRGEANREPIRAAGRLRISEFLGGLYAATGCMSAFSHKIRTGVGQHIDVSIMESVACMSPYPMGSTFPNNPPFPRTRYTYVPGSEVCKDGYIGINVNTGQQWIDLCSLMGLEEWANNPDYSRLIGRLQRREEIKKRMQPWLEERTKGEILEEAQAWRVPAAPIYDSSDILKSPQYLAREYPVEIDHQVMGRATQTGAPFKMTETPWQIKSPAPTLGEHNEEVYLNILGYEKAELTRLRQDGVI